MAYSSFKLSQNLKNKLNRKIKEFSAEYNSLCCKLTSTTNESGSNIKPNYKNFNLEPKKRILLNSSSLFDKYNSILKEQKECKEMIKDKSIDIELKNLAKEDLNLKESQLNLVLNDLAEQMCKIVLKEKKDGKVKDEGFLEVSSGVGGVEAAYFSHILFEMYLKVAEKNKWTFKVLERVEVASKALKSGIMEFKGRGAFEKLKFESGCHRIQRVPVTSRAGKMQTSVAKVSVIPTQSHNGKKIEINKNDLKIDTYRSSGPGGQHVNKTESAVRIKHLPSKIVVSCENSRSQHANKESAMALLRARLEQLAAKKAEKERKSLLKNQNLSGDRSEKIRSYNWPASRVVDHRASMSLNGIEKMMEGMYLTKIWDRLEELNAENAVGSLPDEKLIEMLSRCKL